MQTDEKGRMMKRYALEQLKNWKNSKTRKPLLVQGARQVGKTWLLKEFGRECYENDDTRAQRENNKTTSSTKSKQFFSIHHRLKA